MMISRTNGKGPTRRRGIALRAVLGAAVLAIAALMLGCSATDRQRPQATPLPAASLPVPQYPGARLVSEVVNGQDDVRRVYTTDAAIDEVIRFYQEEAPKYGWQGGSETVTNSATDLDFTVYHPKSIDIYWLNVRLIRHGNQTEIDASVRRRYKG